MHAPGPTYIPAAPCLEVTIANAKLLPSSNMMTMGAICVAAKALPPPPEFGEGGGLGGAAARVGSTVGTYQGKHEGSSRSFDARSRRRHGKWWVVTAAMS